MSNLVILHDAALVPAIELEPGRFATCPRTLPSGSGREVPGEWLRYWLDSLADSGIVGIEPLRPGSWQVATSQFTDPLLLEKILAGTLRDWGGVDSLTGPDSDPVLSGGLALCQGGEVLVEPTCCGDLRNLSDWREAGAYRSGEWAMLWIGHPWLSVRFEAAWLILSELHESATPRAHWAVEPDDLARAVAAATSELENFARWLEPAVVAVAGSDGALTLARKLAGLVR